MYSYLKQIHNGIQNPELPTNKQVAEIKNLRKQYEYLRSQLDEDSEAEHTPSSDESEESEEEPQPKKTKPIKQRAGVSAEVYGTFNKKSDFKPKVVAKTE